MNRKITVYGYQFIEGMLQADEEQSRMVQEIFRVYNSGVPVSRLKDHIEGLEIHRVKLSDMLSDKSIWEMKSFQRSLIRNCLKPYKREKKSDAKP